MKRFKVHVSWVVPMDETFIAEGETEDEAIEAVLRNEQEIGEDYEVHGAELIAEWDVVEPEYVDPNQISFFEENP